MTNRPVVAVVGDDGSVAAAVDAAGGDPRPGPAADVVPGSDAVVAVGEPALLAVARAGPSAPVLPVAAGHGVRSVPREAVEAAVASLVGGEFDADTHPVYDAAVGDSVRARLLLDCMLVTAEPAQISEFAVSAGGEPVARFRADGVVVATPAGSAGYARRAGGPVLPPETDAAVVVPIAPFATDTDHWVVPAGELRVSVERDVAAVDLVAGDRVVGTVPSTDALRLTPAETVDIAVVAASQSPYPSV